MFTATATGFVTVIIHNDTSGNNDYQIYCYGTDGAADSGTVALPPYKVSEFRVSSPSSSSITLTWNSVSDAAKYIIYRANTQTGTPGKVGESTSTSYVDNQVPNGGLFFYTITAVNTDGREGCRLQGAFGIAESHYNLSIYTSAQTLSLPASSKHYYRLAVIKDNSYTIEWQDGTNKNISVRYFRATAYQNDGTVIFNRDNYYGNNGYTNPEVFTATSTGFVTIVVHNDTSNAQNYQIYYY